MIRSLTTAAATCVLALAAPGMAAAQCHPRLEKAAEAVSALPSSVDSRVPDQLNELYAEAEALAGSDEAACLAVVQRMERIIAANGGRTSAPGAANGAQGAFIPRIMPPTAFSRTLPSRMAGLPADRAADVRALGEMVQATREAGALTIQHMASAEPEAAAQVAAAADQMIQAVETVQEVLINLPADVEEAAGYLETSDVAVNEASDRMHAELEDGLRAMEEAEADFDRSFDNAADQTNAAYEEGYRRRVAANERWKRARDETKRVQDRLNRWLDNVNEYSRALRRLQRAHQDEIRRLEVQCDARGGAARTQTARDAAAGNRNSTALADAIRDCQALSVPVRQRQERELEELRVRFGR